MTFTIVSTLQAIAANWSIPNTNACVPKDMYPNEENDAAKWGRDILKLLGQISNLPSATLEDFQRRLTEVIAARINRNKSAKGKTPHMTLPDLKAVLSQYQQLEKAATKTQAKGKARATTPPNLPPPVTPANKDEDEEEEYENSSAPLGFGRYNYLDNVKPVKMDLKPDSPPAKRVLRKRTRAADNEEDADARAAKRPSLVHEDESPRNLDDTGFLSQLTSPRPTRRPRLSRVQQDRVRQPHWQRSLPAVEVGEAALLDGAVDGAAQAAGEEEELGSVVAPSALTMTGLPEIPPNATTTERRRLESMRFVMERRLFTIRALAILERAERERNDHDELYD